MGIIQLQLVNNRVYQASVTGKRCRVGKRIFKLVGCARNDTRAKRKGEATKEREENKRRVPNPIRPIPTHEVTDHVTYA